MSLLEEEHPGTKITVLEVDMTNIRKIIEVSVHGFFLQLFEYTLYLYFFVVGRERHSVRDDSKSRRRHKSSHRSDYHSKGICFCLLLILKIICF